MSIHSFNFSNGIFDQEEVIFITGNENNIIDLYHKIKKVDDNFVKLFEHKYTEKIFISIGGNYDCKIIIKFYSLGHLLNMINRFYVGNYYVDNIQDKAIIDNIQDKAIIDFFDFHIIIRSYSLI